MRIWYKAGWLKIERDTNIEMRNCTEVKGTENGDYYIDGYTNKP